MNLKIKCEVDKKIAEFNFKVLHRILPCGFNMHKQKPSVSEKCGFCNEYETVEHMLYKCSRIQNIWQLVSKALGYNIKLKHVIIGYFLYEMSHIDFCISSIAYLIYKIWLLFSLKENNEGFRICNINLRLKTELLYKIEILKLTKNYLKTENVDKI